MAWGNHVCDVGVVATPRHPPFAVTEMWNKPYPAFVFGSNLSGKHGAGAARLAREWRGAQNGIGEGATGDAYAIPTKDHELHTLPLPRIRAAVDTFLQYAGAHPEIPFQITRIGCGLAGYSDTEIAPFFDSVPANSYLPGVWLQHGQPSLLRVIVTGG